MWSRLGSVAIVKVLVLGVTGIIGIFTSRLIIQSFGVPAYGQYGLLATLPALLPFADLGMAAVIINVVAGSKNPRSDPLVTKTLVTAIRILVGSALVIIGVAALLTLVNGWPTILGAGGLLPD